jgi:hypothetical protein
MNNSTFRRTTPKSISYFSLFRECSAYGACFQAAFGFVLTKWHIGGVSPPHWYD